MNTNPGGVMVVGAFDDPRSRDLRFLEEAARLGPLTVLLWDDATVASINGRAPRFPHAERRYFLEAVRFVTRVVALGGDNAPDAMTLPAEVSASVWVDDERHASAGRAAHAARLGLRYKVLTADRLAGFPEVAPASGETGRRKVVVTGCYDWLHSGHVRFFEEVSGHGDLYVIVGHDANIRLLKGEGHPLQPEAERRYMVGAIRHVRQALISTGSGWLDADPEILRLKPDIYAVNEDGDKGGKREYCASRGIEYLVLARAPAPGLPRRSSTDLRGF